MKPVVLVTANIDTNDNKYNKVSRDYCTSVVSAGGIPLIADFSSINDIDSLLSLADGLLLTGGGDIHSKFFNEPLHEKASYIVEERDEFEIHLFLKAFEKNIPIFGICRGSQLINVALKGNLTQHIESHDYTETRFDPVHSIDIKKDCLLYDIIGKDKLSVNSVHHQCVGALAPDLNVSAYSDDGIIEAIEYPGKKFILGVQWHPEILSANYEKHQKLFDRFIRECSYYQKSKECGK